MRKTLKESDTCWLIRGFGLCSVLRQRACHKRTGMEGAAAAQWPRLPWLPLHKVPAEDETGRTPRLAVVSECSTAACQSPRSLLPAGCPAVFCMMPGKGPGLQLCLSQGKASRRGADGSVGRPDLCWQEPSIRIAGVLPQEGFQQGALSTYPTNHCHH